MDPVNGGIYTCLDRFGNVYSTDKSVWMQGRGAWTFAELCLLYGRKAEWEEASASCIDFLENHCVNRSAGDRLYFAVTGDGRPLRQRRYWHSESFYVQANAAYGALTGKKEHIERARKYYEMLYRLNNGDLKDPTGLGPKVDPQTRKTRGLSFRMMYLNISNLMERYDPPNGELYRKRAFESAEEIVKYHFKPELGCTLESVGPNGEFLSEASETRVVNPGHDIECCWFLFELACRARDSRLKETAMEMFDLAVEKGWDEEYGGLKIYIDALGKPVVSYEHDVKFWWPHNELVIAALMLYMETKDERYLSWFITTINYCKDHFSDPLFGEWYGYLNREGVPATGMVKGTMFKGPFHVPRMLMMADQMLGKLE